MCIFVESTKYQKDGRLKYSIPCRNDLKTKILEVLLSKQLREKMEEKSKTLAEKRFSPTLTKKRFDIAIKAAYTYKNGTSNEIKKMQNLVKKQLENDIKCFK